MTDAELQEDQFHRVRHWIFVVIVIVDDDYIVRGEKFAHGSELIWIQLEMFDDEVSSCFRSCVRSFMMLSQLVPYNDRIIFILASDISTLDCMENVL